MPSQSSLYSCTERLCGRHDAPRREPQRRSTSSPSHTWDRAYLRYRTPDGRRGLAPPLLQQHRPSPCPCRCGAVTAAAPVAELPRTRPPRNRTSSPGTPSVCSLPRVIAQLCSPSSASAVPNVLVRYVLPVRYVYMVVMRHDRVSYTEGLPLPAIPLPVLGLLPDDPPYVRRIRVVHE